MNIEDLDDGLARLKYRVGLLEERAEAAPPTVKLKVAVRDTIAILQKWVKEKGTCLNEDNPDYCEVCSTLPMLEEAFNDYLKTDVRGRTKHGVTLDEANFRHTAEAEQDRLAMFGKAVSHEEAVRDKDNLDRVLDVLEAEQTKVAAKPLTFTLDKKPFIAMTERMTGLELKALLPFDKSHFAIYVESSDMVADVGVGDNESIEVADKTLYSVPPAMFGAEAAKHKVTNLLGRAVEINVNSEKETLYQRDGEMLVIAYEQIIRIACDQIDKSKGRAVKPYGYEGFPMMSVTYRHKVPFDKLPGEREGMLCKGQKVAVTPGMIINAYCT